MMKIIDKDFYYTRIPNENENYFSNLSSEQQDIYLKYYSIYNHLLVLYFMKKYDLKKYDEMLENNKRNFEKVSENDMDVYQYSASEFLKYFYIRNNIYIERLNKEELDFLSKLTNSDLTDENEKFVENTYLKLILEKNSSERVLFGPDNGNFMKPANSIIIGIRYDDFKLRENETEEQWQENYEKRENYLTLMLPMIEKQLNEKTPQIPVSVIQYNDFCVKKKTINNNKKNK